MHNVEALADRMSAKLQKDLEAKGFVIETFIVVSALISIIVNLVKLNQMCKYSPKEALEHIRDPNIIEKIKIRRVIRNGLKDNKLKIPKNLLYILGVNILHMHFFLLHFSQVSIGGLWIQVKF